MPIFVGPGGIVLDEGVGGVNGVGLDIVSVDNAIAADVASAEVVREI